MRTTFRARRVLPILTMVFGLVWGTYNANAEDYNSRLWRVTGQDLHGESYVFGVWDSRDTRAFTFDNAVFKAFDACEFLALEALPDSLGIEVIKMLNGDRLTPGDTWMQNALREPEVKLITGMMEQIAGVAEPDVMQLSPAGIEHLFEQAVCDQTYPYVPEMFFYGYARTHGKNIYGLEPPELHVSAHEFSHSIKRWQDCTVFFRRFQGRPNLTDEVLEQYARGDMGDAVNTMFNYAPPDEIDKWRGARQRNVRMAEHALSLMREQPTFIAVDAMRLTSPIGLINNLREMGYQVEAVPENRDRPPRVQVLSPVAYEWPVYTDSLARIAIALPHDPVREMPDKFKLPEKLAARSVMGVDVENAGIFLVMILGIPGMENGGTVPANMLPALNKTMLEGMNKNDSNYTNHSTRAATIGDYQAIRNRGRMTLINKPAEIAVVMAPGHVVMLIAIGFRDNDYKAFERFFDSVQSIQ